MGLWQKFKKAVKNWFTGGSKKPASSAPAPTIKTTYSAPTYYSGRNVSYDRRALVNSLRDRQVEKTPSNSTRVRMPEPKKTYTYKSLADAIDKKSEGNSNSNSEYKSFATPPRVRHQSTALGTMSERDVKTRTAKMNAHNENRKYQSRAADKLKTQIDEKYSTRKAGAPTYVKQGNYAADPLVAKYNVLKHPTATSATRGGLSGTTLGLSELAIAKLPKSKEMEEAERFYQANKSKGAELAGEMAGSLATFGLTAGATERAATKFAGKVMPKATRKATEALAKKVGAEKATQILKALGTDVVQNLTTGAIYDINKASTEYEPLSEDWWKELGKSAAFNAGVTGIVAGTSLARGSRQLAKATADNLAERGVKESAERLTRNADEAVETAAKVNEVVEPAPRVAEFDEDAYRESLNDVIPFADDLPTTPKRGLPNNYVSREENLRRLTQNEDLPFATVDDAMPSMNPEQTAENEIRAGLDRRVEQLGEQGAKTADDVIRVNDVAGDTPISEELPSGVTQVRSAYADNNGEKIEDGIRTTWDEAWRASKEYSASHATGEKKRMSKVAVSELNAMDSEAERELRQRLVDSGDLDYEAISSAEMYDKIAKQMRDDADRWVKDMIDINEGGALDFRSIPEWQARVQYILGTVDPSADEASEIAYTEAFKLAQNISSKGGQVLNLRRNFVHLTPLGKRDAILDDFVNILSKSKGFNKAHPAMNNLGKFDRRNYIRKFLMEDDAIRDGVNKVVNADNLDDVSEAFAELMLDVNRKNPKVAFDVLQEWRYLSMLGNPKTHIRNVFGSAFFAPMRQTSNTIRSSLEKPIERYATKQSGVKVQVARHGRFSDASLHDIWSNNPTTEAGKAAKEAFDRLKTEVLGSAKYDTVTYKGRAKTAAGKLLDAASDFNSNWLSKEDDFFRSRAFKENYIKSYNRYLKDGVAITDKVKTRIEREALEESRIATFNEFNDFAKMLNNVERWAGDATASGTRRWVGRAANAAMPFTKVPANLMKQSVNYSPLGLLRGMSGIKNAAAKGDAVALNKAIDELASGLTGSAVFGLGMLLGKTTHNMFGLEANVTTNTGKNDPAAKFKKDRGMQNYSITFKDPDTGKGQSFTLDWLVPTSATFFSGVEFANQLKQGKMGLSAFGDWSTVVSRLAEPVMETSMLSGLHGMLETMRGGSKSDDDKGAADVLIRELVQSYLNSVVPTIVGQGARTAYKTDKQVVGDTDWEYWRNQTKSKAGLANTKILGEPLGADTDVFGNVKGEKTTTSDYVKSGLKNFLSPANIQSVDFSEVDKQKLAEYDKAVKDGADPNEMAYLFPKKQYKKQFKVAGEEVKMSNRDLSTYNQAKATGGEEGMRYALESVMFNRRTTDANGKNVPRDDAYTAEQKQALMEEFKGKSMRDVEKWVYAQPEFKDATPAEKKRLIKGLWSLESTFDSKAVASRRVGEQAVIKAQGGDVDEYNFKNEVTEKKRAELLPAVAAGILTYAQIVDFNRNAAKMGYYENEDGGYSKATYNREGILAYLENLDASEEAKEALYNAYYTGKTPYGQSPNRGRYGYGRRGYGRRGYSRRGYSKKSSTPAVKQGNTKVKEGTYKSLASTLPKSSSGGSKPTAKYNTASVKSKVASATKAPKTKKTTVAKVQPPKVKFKKYEV